MIAKPAHIPSDQTQSPIVVAGLFRSANGIGEAARSTYRALRDAGANPIAVDLSEPFAPIDLDPDIKLQPMPDDRRGTLILQLNAPETVSAMQHLGMRRGREWYTIGYWAWELSQFPRDWNKAFRYLSEIWTVSEFTADALRKHRDAPQIQVFGHAVTPPHNLRSARKKFGLDHDEFVFLTMADSMSSLERKNSAATIRAFRAAFPNDPAKKLVVKTRNLDRYETALDDLTLAIGDAQNVQLLDKSLCDRDKWTLIESVDAVVSLHRSEGFGLVLAEAMRIGKPVISTAWSGNMDFTNDQTAALVGYTLVPCEDRYGVYSDKNSKWAEVNAEDAISQMRRIADDEEYRSALGKRAQKHLESIASTISVGSRMRSKLSPK